MTEWRAIGGSGKVLIVVSADDEIDADNQICKPLSRRARQLWRASGYRCEYFDGENWQSFQDASDDIAHVEGVDSVGALRQQEEC